MRHLFITIHVLFLLLTFSIPAFASETLLIIGDSLSSGHGLSLEQRWSTLLQKQLSEKEYNLKVQNSSISGQTTNFDTLLMTKLLEQYHPIITIIALGSNDGLRGLSIIAMQKNLSRLIQLCLDHNSKVLLVGFKLPLNYGPKYRMAFEQVYLDLSQSFPVGFAPFLLEPFALDLNYFQDDNYHPNEQAQPLMLTVIWDALFPLLKSINP